MLPELRKKDADIKSIATKALKDEKLLSELLENLTTKRETIRYNSSKVLNSISREHPEVLYSKWDLFVKLLCSDHTYWKCSAIPIIANLTRADTENKIEKIFEKYYGLLNDKSFIPAAWVAAHSGKIARAKPHLQTKITNKLLEIDKTHHNPERQDLIKSGIIESFDEFFEGIKDKKKIIEFVKNQLECKSPKTRKLAKEFLKKWEQ